MTQIALILFLIATLLEIYGVWRMSNSLLNIPKAKKKWALLSALKNGETAVKAAKNTKISEEKILESLHGLSYLLTGFVIQLLGIVLQTYQSVSST